MIISHIYYNLIQSDTSMSLSPIFYNFCSIKAQESISFYTINCSWVYDPLRGKKRLFVLLCWRNNFLLNSKIGISVHLKTNRHAEICQLNIPFDDGDEEKIVLYVILTLVDCTNR